MTSLDLRLQNDRNRFYVHISDDDYECVKDKGFKISYVGYAVILRRVEGAAHFRVRRGEDCAPEGYRYCLHNDNCHPVLPLFGPYECRGNFDAAGNVYTTLPTPVGLPWPTRYAIKYAFDDEACFELLEQRAKDLRRMGKNILEIPDYMVEYIGWARLKKFQLDNMWLDITRDRTV